MIMLAEIESVTWDETECPALRRAVRSLFQDKRERRRKDPTMFEFKARVLLLLGWLSIGVIPPAPCQQSSPSKEMEIKVPSAGVILRISALGSRGLVSVQNEAGAKMQSLVCPLLRDDVEATEQELAPVREKFVTQFEAVDLDSDGYPDLAGIREFGAKWARYCVWLYDPRQHSFVKDFLAEQMELLTNLASGDGAMVSSSHMGPASPWQAVYQIVGTKGSRPERQLVPLFSCLVETTPGGDKPSAVVTTRYSGGHAVVQRRDATRMNTKEAFSKCSSAEPRARN